MSAQKQSDTKYNYISNSIQFQDNLYLFDFLYEILLVPYMYM